MLRRCMCPAMSSIRGWKRQAQATEPRCTSWPFDIDQETALNKDIEDFLLWINMDKLKPYTGAGFLPCTVVFAEKRLRHEEIWAGEQLGTRVNFEMSGFSADFDAWRDAKSVTGVTSTPNLASSTFRQFYIKDVNQETFTPLCFNFGCDMCLKMVEAPPNGHLYK